MIPSRSGIENQQIASDGNVLKSNEHIVQVASGEESVIRTEIPPEHDKRVNMASKNSPNKEKAIHIG